MEAAEPTAGGSCLSCGWRHAVPSGCMGRGQPVHLERRSATLDDGRTISRTWQTAGRYPQIVTAHVDDLLVADRIEPDGTITRHAAELLRTIGHPDGAVVQRSGDHRPAIPVSPVLPTLASRNTAEASSPTCGAFLSQVVATEPCGAPASGGSLSSCQSRDEPAQPGRRA